mmetsp:Transcript_6475/g.16578  ORF Transcript_6475/g.16578 Transcript_6475/m.16578 type:complete len:234 (-) Transcript_6475:4-705(-)
MRARAALLPFSAPTAPPPLWCWCEPARFFLEGGLLPGPPPPPVPATACASVPAPERAAGDEAPAASVLEPGPWHAALVPPPPFARAGPPPPLGGDLRLAPAAARAVAAASSSSTVGRLLQTSAWSSKEARRIVRSHRLHTTRSRLSRSRIAVACGVPAPAGEDSALFGCTLSTGRYGGPAEGSSFTESSGISVQASPARMPIRLETPSSGPFCQPLRQRRLVAYSDLPSPVRP